LFGEISSCLDVEIYIFLSAISILLPVHFSLSGQDRIKNLQRFSYISYNANLVV